VQQVGVLPPLAFSLPSLPARRASVGALSRPCIRRAFPLASFSFAAPLPSIDSTDVTRVFADIFPGMPGGDHHLSGAVEVSRFPC
jgi:hypothetical protein